MKTPLEMARAALEEADRLARYQGDPNHKPGALTNVALGWIELARAEKETAQTTIKPDTSTPNPRTQKGERR
jgi:hypothetical protein